MKIANSNDFVSIISEEMPAICVFYSNDDELDKIDKIFKKIEKEAALLNVYKFDMNDEKINFLADTIEVPDTPVLMIFKDGNFSRYKNKRFNDKEIRKFIGSLRRYTITTKEESND